MTATIEGFEIHPAAGLWPAMDGRDFEELKKDVQQNGLRSPIVTYQGKILDGRNRLRACLAIGMSKDSIPMREIVSDSNPYLFVISANARRLHLGPRERAAHVVKLLQESGELARMREQAEQREAANLKKNKPPASAPPPGGTGRVAEQIARAANTSTRTVERVLAEAQEVEERAEEPVAEEAPKPRRALKDNTKKLPEAWRVPREVNALAKFLCERLTSTERLRLAKKLMEG